MLMRGYASWFEHDGITMITCNLFIFKKNASTFYMSVVIRKRTVLLSRIGLLDPCHFSSFLFHPESIVGALPHTRVPKVAYNHSHVCMHGTGTRTHRCRCCRCCYCCACHGGGDGSNATGGGGPAGREVFWS